MIRASGSVGDHGDGVMSTAEDTGVVGFRRTPEAECDRTFGEVDAGTLRLRSGATVGRWAPQTGRWGCAVGERDKTVLTVADVTVAETPPDGFTSDGAPVRPRRSGRDSGRTAVKVTFSKFPTELVTIAEVERLRSADTEGACRATGLVVDGRTGGFGVNEEVIRGATGLAMPVGRKGTL